MGQNGRAGSALICGLGAGRNRQSHAEFVANLLQLSRLGKMFQDGTPSRTLSVTRATMLFGRSGRKTSSGTPQDSSLLTEQSTPRRLLPAGNTCNTPQTAALDRGCELSGSKFFWPATGAKRGDHFRRVKMAED